ncbi:MAG TPA: pro-sigmaK processing inhibitor BofA [Clostridiaceae bacterium]|nr:pro-sigmaK processing inhibitor BofA [Clostridiaceae bacterium]
MKPLKFIFKLAGNAILGTIILTLLNPLLSTYFSFHININFLSMLITGFLGIPGIILLIALKSLFVV